MNNTYGETMGYFSSVAEWYNALIKNSDAYCRQMVIEARTRMLANQIAEKEQNIHDLKYDETGKARQYSTKREYKQEEVSIQSYHMGMSGGTRPTSIEIPGTSELDKATAKVKEERDAVAGLQKQLRDLVKESASIKMPVIGTTSRPTGGKGGSTSGGGDDKKAPAAEGSINRYKERLADLRKQIEETGDANLAANLQKQYEALEAEFKAHKIKIGLEKPEPQETKTYMDSLREQLATAQKSFDNATTVEARVEAIAKIDEIQAKINEATHGKVTIEAETDMSYVTLGSTEDKRQSAQNAQAKASRIQQDFEIGLIGKEEAEKGISSINKLLGKLGLKPINIKFKTDGMRQVEERMKGACDSVKQLGGSLAGLGEAIGVPELNIAGTMAQAIATMVTGYATATTQAATLGPWAWIAFAALGLAQLTAMITSVKDVAKFADGAVAYGPTLGLFGEYANAATNPEVVAPLDKLRGILGVEGGGGQVDIKLRMRGRDLVGVSSKRTKLVRRS